DVAEIVLDSIGLAAGLSGHGGADALQLRAGGGIEAPGAQRELGQAVVWLEQRVNQAGKIARAKDDLHGRHIRLQAGGLLLGGHAAGAWRVGDSRSVWLLVGQQAGGGLGGAIIELAKLPDEVPALLR